MKLTKSKLKQIIKEEINEYETNPHSQRADMESVKVAEAKIQQMMKDLLHELREIGDFESYDKIEAIMNPVESPMDTFDDEEDYNPEYYNRYGGHPGDDDDD
jgi:hypothetical protein